VRLWRKIRTVEDPRWTERYHATDPAVKAFGGRIIIRFESGGAIADELAVANAHPLGAAPWRRPNYIAKFNTLTEGIVDPAEARRFLEVVQNLSSLTPKELADLTIALPDGQLAVAQTSSIFSWAR